MYTLILINGQRYDITESEYNSILGKSGMQFFPSIKVTVNMSSVSCIEPKGLGDKAVDRSKQTEGMLKDGTRMIKQFGRWYCADGQKDEQGRLCTEADPTYYPEIKSGILPTPEEYAQEFRALPAEQWAARLVGSNPERPQLLEGRSTQGLTKV